MRKLRIKIQASSVILAFLYFTIAGMSLYYYYTAKFKESKMESYQSREIENKNYFFMIMISNAAIAVF